MSIFLSLGFSQTTEAQTQLRLTTEWQQVGNTCYACGSALFLAYKDYTPDENGYYWTYIYVWSNSYDKYGYLVTTYINSPRISSPDAYGNLQTIIKSPYYLAEPATNGFHGWNLMYSMYSYNPNQVYYLDFINLEDY